MIELGLISLRYRTSVYDARAKIRSLANALGYDPIETTRLATAVSEATRVLHRDNIESRIAVGLAMELSPPQLVLDIECRGEAPRAARLAGSPSGPTTTCWLSRAAPPSNSSRSGSRRTMPGFIC